MLSVNYLVLQLRALYRERRGGGVAETVLVIGLLAALELVEENYYRMYQVGNAMMRRPKYAELGGKTYARGSELLVAKARQERTPQLLAAAGVAAIK